MEKQKRKAIVIFYSLSPIQSYLLGFYHHLWLFKRLPFIPILPMIPCHSSLCRSRFLIVYSVQIRSKTCYEPPSIPVGCCTVTPPLPPPLVIVVVFRRKHHFIVMGKGILYEEDNNINLLQTIMTTWILRKKSIRLTTVSVVNDAYLRK